MPVQFGNTWWGQAYLGALTQIDYENRLARGKSYARNDRIVDIDISQNEVQAKVRGSRPQPYSIKIIHTPFTPAEQKKLVEVLASRPDLLSEILNLRLPVEIKDICAENKIKLFPASWRDIKLTCSCPDWAVPCKHLAAVIYTIANEIDKDPFLVFKLHKFDLFAALRKKGHLKEITTSQDSIPSIHSLISEKDLTRGWPTFDINLYERIDLSKIPKLGTTIPNYLDPQPVFYPAGDFRWLLEQQFTRVADYVKRLTVKKNPEKTDLDLPFLRKMDYIEVVLNHDMSFNCMWLEGAEEEDAHTFQKVSEVVEWILNLNREVAVQLAPDFSLILLAWEIAQHVIDRGAILPMLYSVDGSFIIHWEPFLSMPSVADIIHQFDAILRHDFITYETEKKKLKYIHPEKQAAILVSLFINDMIKESNRRTQKYDDSSVTRLFFEGLVQPFSSFTEKNISQSIQQWVDGLLHASSVYAPCLFIHEKGNGQFDMHIEMAGEASISADWIPLDSFLSEGQYQEHHLPALKMLSRLGDRIPAIRMVIKHSGKKKILLSEDEVIHILEELDHITMLTKAKIVLPKSLQEILRPKRTLQIRKEARGKSTGILGLSKLLAFDWRIALGDHFITTEEFRQMTETSGRLVKIKDHYVILDPHEIASLLTEPHLTKVPTGIELMKYALAQEYEGSSIEITTEVKKWLQTFRDSPDIKLPHHLHATLRPYQLNGYSWLWKNAQLGFGSILADDMGLGKTIQVLAFLQKAKQEGSLKEGPVLIVAPATLLINWVRESERFTPSLVPMIYHGSKRALPNEPFDLLITTYGLARMDQKILAKISWSVLVIDEAQYIKSTTAAQTKSILSIPAKIKIAMSGTPVENRLSEYFSISQFANPGYLGTLSSFRRDFATPIETHRDQHRLDIFKRMTAPFLMRRLKTDKSIIQDLPEKIILNRYVTLTPEQASLYEVRTKEVLAEIQSASTGISRKGLVLKMLLQLKQICNHPFNFLKQGKKHADLTGKTEALKEILDHVRGEGRKVLIFTQYREMGDILIDMIREWGEEAQFLHGGLSRKQRDEIITSFQEHHWPSILILSIKAAGTGLNLTAATHVIHYDLWWNPAVEAQATDRAFRIGQKHNVTVHRIITRNTLEENIDQLIQKKKDLADMTITTGEKWIGDMTDTEIAKLVRMR